jgi:hypothetical protein
MCRKEWVVHGYSDTLCSIWKEPDPDDAMTEATRTLEKWLFYYDRFNNHEMSARLDQELFEATEEKMVEVQKNSNLSWIEVSSLPPIIIAPTDNLNPLIYARSTVKIYAKCCRYSDKLSGYAEVELRHGILSCSR